MAVARAHGDEFVVILADLVGVHESGSLAQGLLDVIRAPMYEAGTTVGEQASIGVALTRATQPAPARSCARRPRCTRPN